MKRYTIVIGAALALALGNSVSAQQPSSSSAEQENEQSRNRTVTVAGCLQSDQSSSAAGGAATRSASRSTGADRFVLANATMSSSVARTDFSSASTNSGATYVLDVPEGRTQELRQEANHQVEITGRLEPGASNGLSAPGGPRLRVDSVRLIASSCSK